MEGGGVKTLCLAILLLSVVAGSASAEEKPQTLQEGSWVCTTPEAYDRVVQEERDWQGKDLEELKKRVREEKRCSYIDHEYLDGLLFFQVLARQGEKVKVSFIVEFRRSPEVLRRNITVVRYTGWTGIRNLRSLE